MHVSGDDYCRYEKNGMETDWKSSKGKKYIYIDIQRSLNRIIVECL